jgi:hypothetical protein
MTARIGGSRRRGSERMTVFRLFGIALRRWYVLVVGLVCIVAACAVLQEEEGVYWAQTDVLFLAGDKGGNPLENQTENVIHFASVIQASLDEGAADIRLSSPSATLHGTGVRSGFISMLADTGGQWGSNFNRAVIRIEAVDESPEQVRGMIAGVVADIESETARLQSASGVGEDASTRISVDTGPDAVSVGYMGSTRGSRYRGFAVIALIGGVVSLTAAALLDRALLARREKRAAVGEPVRS